MKPRRINPKSETANEKEKNRVTISVAVIGAVGVILAAIITIIPQLLPDSSTPTSFVISPTIAITDTPHPTPTLIDILVSTSHPEITPSFSGVCYYHSADASISLSVALAKFSLLYDPSTSYYYCNDMKGLGCVEKVFLQSENDALPPDTWLAILAIKNVADCDLSGGIVLPP